MIEKAIIEVDINGILLTEHHDAGNKVIKNISVADFRDRITKNTVYDTGLLPPGVRMYKRGSKTELLLLETPPSIKEVEYNDRYGEFNGAYKIPTPWTLWFFSLRREDNGVRRWHGGAVYAMKGPVLNLETQLYMFPFSNTNGWICWGDIQLPSWRNLIGVGSLPTIFYNGEFNRDLDGSHFRPFMSEKEEDLEVHYTDELFFEIDGKDEFPVDILYEEFTLGEALERHTDLLF